MYFTVERIPSKMCESQGIQTVLRPSFLYSIVPNTLRLSSFASLRRSVRDYSVRSRKGVISPVSPAKREDVDVNRDRTGSVSSSWSHCVDTGKNYAIQGRISVTGSRKANLILTGSHLLNTSLARSELRDPHSQGFSRRLYVNSITYLLQGLPPDLSEQEIFYLQSALPKSLNRSHCSEAASCQRRAPSMLHRAIASFVVSFCLLIRLTLPYIKYLLALAYSYERKHHLTENPLAASQSAADSLGRKSKNVAETAMDNKMVVDTMTYCVEGICGGLNEGLGEGVKAIEA